MRQRRDSGRCAPGVLPWTKLSPTLVIHLWNLAHVHDRLDRSRSDRRLVAWIVMIYNQLVAMRQRVGQAFADVDVQLKLRHDPFPTWWKR